MSFDRRVVKLFCRDRRVATVLEFALIAGIILATVAIGFDSFNRALSNHIGSL